MNKTEKTCFFFEDIYLNFDEAEGVFVTNIVTCVLNSVFSPVTCLGNLSLCLRLSKPKIFIRRLLFSWAASQLQIFL